METITIRKNKDLLRLRRLALDAQGLLKKQAFGTGAKGTLNAIGHLGYIQLDTISVIERAHHHVLFSRVPGFKTDMSNTLLKNRQIFEYWSHAAAFLPMQDYRFSLPYKHAIKSGQTHWFKNPDQKLMSELQARIRSDGPLRSRDLETNTPKRQGWWDWKPAKKALEQLYMQGDLMVCDRQGFQKTYDLTERVLPSGIDTHIPDNLEFADFLLQQQLRCHGFASVKGITYLRKNKGLRQQVKQLVNEKLNSNELQQLELASGECFVIPTGDFEKTLPRAQKQLHILSPFDNAVIQRDRLKSLFQFDYQLECYVPEAKRQYGYFSLPLLYGDHFIGQMDCKAHRKSRQLEIKALHLELQNLDQDEVIAAFVTAIHKFSQFQQCDAVTITQVQPAHLFDELKWALNNI